MSLDAAAASAAEGAATVPWSLAWKEEMFGPEVQVSGGPQEVQEPQHIELCLESQETPGSLDLLVAIGLVSAAGSECVLLFR